MGSLADIAIDPALAAQLVAWRRDFHAHPELSNREFRTAKIVTDHLRALGLDVTTGIAHTGVVGILNGAKPGPCVALRADMDALPVAEEVDLPFASTARTEYEGDKVGVMHACGHDAHTAILMTVASLLTGMKDRIAGTVKFIFQPAEEGAPRGERGGAALMIEEGVLADPVPAAIFGLHVLSPIPSGVIGVRIGALMAAVDNFDITIHGKQTHGAMPWLGVDPIVAAAHVITGVQGIVSRQIDISEDPAVLTIGAIRGGVRENIVPDSVTMKGTIRTFNEPARAQVAQRLRDAAVHIACGCGASAEVEIRTGYPVTVNHAGLTKWSVPILERVAGKKQVQFVRKLLGGEDFSYFQQKVPGLFFFLGCTPTDSDATQAPANHSPRFFVDEAVLPLGVRALTALTLDFLAAPPPLTER